MTSEDEPTRVVGKVKVTHEAYGHRDISTLQSLQEIDREKSLRSNTILQGGIADRSGIDAFDDARNAGEMWITDAFCPTMSTAIKLHIAKELVVNYRVASEDYAPSCDDIYQKFFDKNLIDSLQSQIQGEISNQKNTAFQPQELEEKAEQRLERNGVDVLAEGALAAAKAVEFDIAKKHLLDQKLRGLVAGKVKSWAKEKGIEGKSRYKIGQNKDYCFLGAAGSGKSTVAKLILKESQDSTDYVALSTDDYRLFTPQVTQGGDQFIRTQDYAYLVKDLVKEEIELQMEESGQRPNIQCDGVNLESFMRQLLDQGKNVTSVLAAYAPAGNAGIAERADHRARTSQNQADKDRFVNTNSLFEGHAKASERLFTGIPQNTVTALYDTDVERGASPQNIGEVDPAKKELRVDNLRQVAGFMNKRNINKKAVSPVEALLSGSGGYTTSPERKVSSLLNATKEGYQVILRDSNKKEYARLSLGDDGEVKLSCDRRSVFERKIKEATIEAGLLKEVERQVSPQYQEGKREIEKGVGSVRRLKDKNAMNASVKNGNSRIRATNLRSKKEGHKL